MAITNDNLFSESYASVKAFLNGISGLDPRGRFKANYIHASMPNINQKGFDGYPFIILKVDLNENTKSFDSAISEKDFNIQIGVYSDDPPEVDSMCDKIVGGVKDVTNLTDFPNKELSSSPMDWSLNISGKKISFRLIGVIARSRIWVLL